MDAVAKSWLSRRVQALIVPGSALVAELCTCSDPKLGVLNHLGYICAWRYKELNTVAVKLQHGVID